MKTSTKMLIFFFSNKQVMQWLWADGITRRYGGSIPCFVKYIFVIKIFGNVRNEIGNIKNFDEDVDIFFF